MEMTFDDTDTTGVSALLVAVRNNSFGDFKVDPDAVTVVITGKWLQNALFVERETHDRDYKLMINFLKVFQNCSGFIEAHTRLYRNINLD